MPRLVGWEAYLFTKTRKAVKKTFLPKELPMMMFWGMVAGFATYAIHQFQLPGVYDKLQLTVIVVTVGLFAGIAVRMPIISLVGPVFFFGKTILAVHAANSAELTWTGGGVGNYAADFITLLVIGAPGLAWINRREYKKTA